ncbi:MAG: multifunctional oxoglutarate decarboxylase/oxoglutarate dehydrogenase thiamine pyrophosphate-binding subunit/dihydrolipoyllysine-residue succinyltransferase subunit [Chloroherpetonaceae bacterium]|nr:multifunctional oxoglutarate decarboxylase/oxoglutarate dehydrogenase thiamine pyrophosphate-binding subunit/dihydrolipoyllysine-residue succinyltransferase subunit [Chloroherpetonaceae bacterium]
MSITDQAVQEKLVEIFGFNTLFIEDLYQEYEKNPEAVKQSWRLFFDDLRQGKVDLSLLEHDESRYHEESAVIQTANLNASSSPRSISASSPANGVPKSGTPIMGKNYNTLEELKLGDGEKATAILGTAVRIVENMQQSLSVPTATSVRTIAVKVLEENRIIINQHLSATGGGKIAFTHIIAWAIVKAAKKIAAMNASFATVAGKPYRIEHQHIAIGLAVDMTKKDGSRSLVVPNIKSAEQMNFAQFFAAYNKLIAKSRKNQLDPADFQGTTISLTNPGTIGTASSVPRLMEGQGAIIATGAIDFPPEYQAMSPEVRAQLGISKVMTTTSTYDHRIIQGAESGEFLALINRYLQGEENFYDEIFTDLKMPYKPWKSMTDKSTITFGGAVNMEEVIRKQARVMQMINAYRVRGHLIANINPLGYEPTYHPELDPEFYELTLWDLDREFITMSFGNKDQMLLRDVIGILRSAYCEKTGVEFMNIQSLEQKRWIQQHCEDARVKKIFTKAEKEEILYNLIRAEGFERYLHTKFLGHKRFSIEGGETAIAISDYLVKEAATYGTEEVVIGMAHRGRLNVLTNVIGKSYETLFAEFEGKKLPLAAGEITQGSGDVKYHLGATGKRTGHNGKEVTVSVASNPSHLEAVNPVVEGIVRAKQDRRSNFASQFSEPRRKAEREVLSFLIHGDAAFAGQGVVAETLNLSKLKGYATGGTIHLIINNQIGFTTGPDEARSTLYATDVAKMVQAPIFHVNGEDPEACIRVIQMALEYRMTYGGDVVIDMMCYRRHGHNEGDDPAYTQPVLYKKIKDRPSVREIYAQDLIREGSFTEAEVEALMNRFKDELDQAYEKAKAYKATHDEAEIEQKKKADLTLAISQEELPVTNRNPETSVPLETLQQIVESMFRLPEGFRINKKLEQQFAKRKQLLGADASQTQIDWGFAESLAYGSIVLSGHPVRLSGQDSTRGTFSQRHLAFVETETGEEFIPLRHITPTQAQFNVFDSLLSEFAVMGFEFGYSVADPLSLVLWEAQFGDFANGAQIMIDQFIASTESKWGQKSGLVLLLPHGYEGQGPEHSSARLERFLQLCAETNMQVAYPTTPAQYFHLLRRQIISGNIKPLVVMTPKSLLRHPLAVSVPQDLTNDRFHNVLDDVQSPTNVKRIALCSGKVYYDLHQYRVKEQRHDVAVVRVEQFYPFPKKKLQHLFEKYGTATEVVWVQEEPKNMGAWSFLLPRLMEIVPASMKLRYIGRPSSASPATGFLKQHEAEQLAICVQTFE